MERLTKEDRARVIADLRVLGFHHDGHPVPVRRQPRLPELRLHRVRRPGGHRPASDQGVIPVGQIFAGSLAVGRAVARLAGRGRGPDTTGVGPRTSSTPA